MTAENYLSSYEFAVFRGKDLCLSAELIRLLACISGNKPG